jgi:hypothetical protein
MARKLLGPPEHVDGKPRRQTGVDLEGLGVSAVGSLARLQLTVCSDLDRQAGGARSGVATPSHGLSFNG